MPRMTGAEFMVQMMKAYGVTHTFYMPMIVTKALVEMEKAGIRRIMAHSEKGAAYMADGYARAAHRSHRLPSCQASTIVGIRASRASAPARAC